MSRECYVVWNQGRYRSLFRMESFGLFQSLHQYHYPGFGGMRRSSLPVVSLVLSISFLAAYCEARPWDASFHSWLNNFHENVTYYYIGSGLVSLSLLLASRSMSGSASQSEVDVVAAISDESGEAQQLSTAVDSKPFDIAIIGAGNGGCLLALNMVARRKDLRIALIDSDWSEQRRVVGELIQPRGVDLLREMGLLNTCVLQENVSPIPSFGYTIVNPHYSRPARYEESAKEFCLPTKGSVGDTSVLKYPAKRPEGMLGMFGFLPTSGSKKDDTKSTTMNSAAPQLTSETVKQLRAGLSGKRSNGGPNESGSKYSQPAPLSLGMHNSRFLQNLRNLCGKHPRITCIDGNVTKINTCKVGAGEHATGVKFCYGSEEFQCNSALTLAADGGRNAFFRNMYAAELRPKMLCTWIGLLLKHEPYATPINNPGYASVILCRPSPVLAYQIAPDHTRVLICVVDEQVEACAGGSYYDYVLNIIVPQLPTCIGSVVKKIVQANKATFDGSPPPTNEDEEEIITFKNNYLMSASNPTQNIKNYLTFGDALNTRHALTGSGITVLLSDTRVFANLLSKVSPNDWPSVLAAHTLFVEQRRHYAGPLNTLACALTEVFSTPFHTRDISASLGQSCYSYIATEGPTKRGPVGLLAGLSPSPNVLTIHFFLVVLYSTFNVNILLNPARVYQTIKEGVRIILPLLTKEKITPLASWPCRTLIKLIFPH